MSQPQPMTLDVAQLLDRLRLPVSARAWLEVCVCGLDDPFFRLHVTEVALDEDEDDDKPTIEPPRGPGYAVLEAADLGPLIQALTLVQTLSARLGCVSAPTVPRRHTRRCAAVARWATAGETE